MDSTHSSRLVHKTMRLQPQTVSAIAATADNLNTNFNRTVEHLLQLGLQYTHKRSADLDFELQRILVDQGVSRALNRYLKLLSQTTIAANEAKEMAQQLFFRQLCEIAEKQIAADDVYDTVTLYPDDNESHAALLAIYEQRKQRGHDRALALLRKLPSVDADLWRAVTRWDDAGVDAEQSADTQKATAQADEALRDLIDDAVGKKLNRHLRLLVKATIAAIEAREMMQQVFFRQLCELTAELANAEDVPHTFALDTSQPTQAVLYELFKQRKLRARNRAVRQLKAAIAIDKDAWQQLLAQLED